jgi:hypothetical protein
VEGDEREMARPQDYSCADSLFYATNRVLAEIGRGLRINYAHNVVNYEKLLIPSPWRCWTSAKTKHRR